MIPPRRDSESACGGRLQATLGCIGLRPKGFMRMAGISRVNREVLKRVCLGRGGEISLCYPTQKAENFAFNTNVRIIKGEICQTKKLENWPY